MGSIFKNLGFGLGLRAPHYSEILQSFSENSKNKKITDQIDWFEATTENYMGLADVGAGRPLEVLLAVRQHKPIVLHGVSLNIGSVDKLNTTYLKKLKDLERLLQPEWMSDHLCWTGVNGQNLHDLLPLPYTQETIDHLCERIDHLQNFLQRTFIFENVSSYMSFEHSEMTEWEFLTTISKKTGCGLLLDVNNVYVSSINHSFDPLQFIEGVPWEKVAYMHLAGHANLGNHLIDTHDQDVCQEVWSLYKSVVQKYGSRSTLLERDDKIPALYELVQELSLAKKYSKIQRSRGSKESEPPQERGSDVALSL